MTALPTLETARTRRTDGAHSRRNRKRLRAREELRAALESIERLGAGPWADHAGAKLAATGETTRRRNPGTRDELIPQELQIARLRAEARRRATRSPAWPPLPLAPAP